jgi:cold shock CspA family protein
VISAPFSSGESIAVRQVACAGIRSVEPAIVVSDDPVRTVLYRPAGTPLKVPPSFRYRTDPVVREEVAVQELLAGTTGTEDAVWSDTNVLLVADADEWNSTWLWWNSTWGAFAGYYINFELPWRRFRLGFDTSDLCLDLVVSPALEWEWKDREAFEHRVSVGLIPRSWEASISASADRVLQRIASHAPPFDGSLADWRPDAGWRVPPVPGEWNDRPTARGRVKFFRSDKGWGGIESDETPDDVWIHFSMIAHGGAPGLAAGDEVEFTYEPALQDSWRYRAITVRKL